MAHDGTVRFALDCVALYESQSGPFLTLFFATLIHKSYSIIEVNLKEYKIKTGLLDRPRTLILAKDYIEFENKNLKSDLFTQLLKSDIVDFKRSLERIIWYEFSVGYVYSLSFLDKNNKPLDISFRNYLGLQPTYGQFYSELITLIWEYYFTDVVNTDLDKIYSNEELKINNLKIGLGGVEFTDTKELIDWKNLDHKEYFGYFAIHKSGNSKIHRTYNFNEWNSERLFCIIRTIKKDRGN